MGKIIFALFLFGGIVLFLGLKLQDKGARTLGLGLIGVAILLILLSSLGSIDIFPEL